MLFAADVAKTQGGVLTGNYWMELGEPTLDELTREFSNQLTVGSLREVEKIDDLYTVMDGGEKTSKEKVFPHVV